MDSINLLLDSKNLSLDDIERNTGTKALQIVDLPV